MAKIGRNQPCPCGSGRKYKRCCINQDRKTEPISQEAQAKVSLANLITKVQKSAEEKRDELFEFGVFIFFSNSNGDAWMLEVSERDCLQVAKDGEALEVDLSENPETIEINWSHTWKIENKQLFITSYLDKSEISLEDVPVDRVKAALKRILKRYPPEVLAMVHDA